MIHPTKLVRGAFLALAMLGAVSIAGPSIPLVGVVTAQAAEQLVGSVLFEGNRRFSDAQLLDMVDISASGIFSQQRLAADIESIRQAYDREGFLSISIASRVETTTDGRARVVFVVDEGNRAGIAAINFTGNNAMSAGNLKGRLLTKETGILSWLFKDDAYDKQKLAVDRERVRLYYANHGYPDAQVTSVGEYDAAHNAYFINFTINEGQKYEFSGVSIETSIPGLNTDALKGTVKTGEGRRYSVNDLQSTIADMSYEATTQGYSFADVRARLDRDVANGTFKVTYLVDEGPRVYVERINITGNTKTRDFVIRRELEFAEGDPFNRALLMRGRSNIDDLGFFSAVNVTTASGSAPDKVIINVAVTETSTGEYGAAAGYSTVDGILGEISLTERNFLGRGQYLRAAIGASQAGRTFDLSFTEPRFMGLKISSGLDAYHRITEESRSTFYGSQATGGQLRLGIPLTSDLSATVFAGSERRVIADTNDNSTYQSSLVIDGQEFTKAFVGYSLTWNGLDNVKKPTIGLYATFSQQYIGWDHNLIKSEARARYFVPVIEDSGIVASLKGQAGVIDDLSSNGVHAVEAFNPGTQLIRGFEGRGLGPRLQSGEYLGSTMYAGISAELNFSIPAVPESYGLSGAIWANAAWVDGLPRIGTGSAPLSNGDPSSQNVPWRTSIGASLIWDSPFGPLRGDIAHVLNKSTADRTQVFQLSLQTPL
ncbi:MAG: outer membrane protein assembly factor BamA [Candidatus Devosia symbiotica]|nr:outer membrane protein assembly factor BamA [Candidatus Devosia symbiotica]